MGIMENGNCYDKVCIGLNEASHGWGCAGVGLGGLKGEVRNLQKEFNLKVGA